MSQDFKRRVMSILGWFIYGPGSVLLVTVLATCGGLYLSYFDRLRGF